MKTNGSYLQTFQKANVMSFSNIGINGIAAQKFKVNIVNATGNKIALFHLQLGHPNRMEF